MAEEKDGIEVAIAKAVNPLVFISHDMRDAELAEAFSHLLKSVSAGVLKSLPICKTPSQPPPWQGEGRFGARLAPSPAKGRVGVGFDGLALHRSATKALGKMATELFS